MAENNIEKIVLTPRDTFGKIRARQARKNGMIPVVLTAHGKSESFFIKSKEVFRFTETNMNESKLWNAYIEGKETENIEIFLKDYQIDRLTDEILHLDFFRVTRGEKIRTHVGLVFTGTPKGIKAGGVLETYIEEVEIECFPRHLIGEIRLDITNLEIHQSLRTEDLPSIEGIVYHLNPETVILSVGLPKSGPTVTETSTETESVS